MIYREEIEDDENILLRERRFIKAKEGEKLGLKHFLGHTKNLPYNDCGLAISKSSYSLNKLQDVLIFFRRFEFFIAVLSRKSRKSRKCKKNSRISIGIRLLKRLKW